MNNMVIFGAKGFIGCHAYQYFQKLEKQVIATHYKPEKGCFLFDLKNPTIKHLPLEKGRYKYALIAASFAGPKQCHFEKELSFLTNVEGVLQLAEQLNHLGITPIVFSSSYVFDGKSGNYVEEDSSNPLNNYGLFHAKVEKRLNEVCGNNFINIRLSKVYGTEKGDGTLLDEITRELIGKKVIRAASDQIHSPIHVKDVIHGIHKLQEIGFRGLIHFAGPDRVSRYDIAIKIAKK
ncbi:MAG: sugar nucleotide-binding protein, partial [Simkaniaceae bacterium]|nr:sugar nucleotide-binding protein [Simkaniaceae bacterium]